MLENANYDPDFEKRYQSAIANARTFSKALEGPSLAERFARLPPASRDGIMAQLGTMDLARLRHDWGVWARPKQDPDLAAIPHRIFFLLGGRGSGKTIAAAHRVRRRVEAGARSIAIVGPTLREIERYQIKGEGGSDGILTVFPPRTRPEYKPHKALVFFHRAGCAGCGSAEGCGGAVAYINSAEDPEFRGPNLDSVWCLIGETLITMGDGTTKRIDAVCAGDKVATRKGPRRVAWAGRTRRDAPLWRLTASNGATLTGTGDHEVLAGGEFARIKNLALGAKLFPLPTRGPRWVVTVKQLEQLAEPADVYDLTIEDVPEFFANGLLVHNCDEPAKWRYLSTIWSNIELATRLRATLPLEIILTGTPLPLQLFRELITDEETVTILMAQSENAANLDAKYLARMQRKYGGTRLGRQELEGEILSDNPDALFQSSVIDATRVESRPAFEEVAVSVDPAIATNPENDETGIICGGRDAAGHIYILADASSRSKPEKWGADVVATCQQWEADIVVGERNRGGDLVAANVRAAKERRSGAVAAKALRIVEVHATRGKAIRAEPVSALSDRGMIHIVGRMPELESELTDWNPRIGGRSPNRLDALVWLVWYLARLGDEDKPDYRAGFRGVAEASAGLRGPAPLGAMSGLMGALPRSSWGSKL